MGFDRNLLPKEGESYYFPNLFDAPECDQLFTFLQTEVPWVQEPIRLFGKTVMQPRLTALCGDYGASYRYSGIEMIASPWNDALEQIRDRLESISRTEFNVILLNLYRDEKDSMGWHSDDEKELGMDPIIASVSFGATRRFHFRHRSEKSLKTFIDLENGSLLLMRGATQAAWQHSIPKETKSRGLRLNLTFRTLIALKRRTL
ncbi:MAG: alpha-ketoglutarate-dependent dioxygenase AlkB [Cryobacterium sp.]|nr:alpha-ketoglutarate-dependent dioxygenase AlkB [Oligoflexia bacterium]